MDLSHRHRANPSYSCSSTVMHDHKMRHQIQIFPPKLSMLNSRLPQIYKAHDFRHHSAVCLCTTEAPLIWSGSMKAADSPRLQTEGLTRRQHVGQIYLRDSFKHMPSCYAALFIYLKHISSSFGAGRETWRKMFCRDKQAPLTRNSCVIENDFIQMFFKAVNDNN